MGLLRRRAATGLVALGLGVLTAANAFAQAEQPRVEFFTGLEVNDNSLGGYAGTGYAFGKGLYDSGWRARAVGSLGLYHYDGSLPVGGAELPTRFDGDYSFIAALIGYQFRAGRLITKLFVGIEAENQHIVPRDPRNAVQGSELGLRLLAENWIDLSPRVYLSADAAYGTAFQEYWGLARLGYRVTPRLSLGIEGGALGNEEYNTGRGGGFLRLHLRAAEITLSSGFTGNYLEDEPSGYLSVGIHRAF